MLRAYPEKCSIGVGGAPWRRGGTPQRSAGAPLSPGTKWRSKADTLSSPAGFRTAPLQTKKGKTDETRVSVVTLAGRRFHPVASGHLEGRGADRKPTADEPGIGSGASRPDRRREGGVRYR